MNNNRKASLAIGMSLIAFVFLCAFDEISFDTFYICVSIFISANAIILALAKNDNNDDKK